MNREPIRHDRACRLCGSGKTTTVLHLAATPPEDRFVTEAERQIPQPAYPLDLALCESCGYLHLPFVLSPEISYTDYIYVTGVTLGLKNHYQEYADQVLALTRPDPGALVVDLGSNDGTMLEAFKRHGFRVLGVEPAQAIARAANEAGIPTLGDFFTDAVVNRVLDEHGPAAIVTANYMYANIDDVAGFTRNVARLLAPDGVFVVQTGYHPEQMKLKMFDYIYHEHFSYFTAKVLCGLMARCGLMLIGVEKTRAKGGSLRATAQRADGRRSASPTVARLIEEEDAAGMDTTAAYLHFAGEIERARGEVRSLLGSLKSEDKRMVGYGASHSTTTLTYHFGLAEFMEYIVDDNPLKHGRYSPGYHLPVFPSVRLYDDKPDVALVLAWQYQDAIIGENQRFLEQGGKFIAPLPVLRVI